VTVRPEQLKPAPPLLPDDRAWRDEALAARHKSLATIQATAAAWEKTIGAVLGTFALAAFIKGPQALSDIPTGPQSAMAVQLWVLPSVVIDPARTVGLLIFVAAALLMIAVVAAAVAAQGVPVWVPILDAVTLQLHTRSASQAAITWLWISRICTIAAAALVFVAMAVAWTATLDKPAAAPAQSAIVTTASGSVCGELRNKGGGILEVMPKGGSPLPVAAASQLVLIAKCPAAP
jgi:hypothetical protein